MNLSKFFKAYDTNEKCRQFFIEQRQHEGIKCRKCSGSAHCWLPSKYKWRCVNCRYETGIKTGTVMENSNLDYKTWLTAIFLMSVTKKGFSALEMQRLIGHSRYESIWLLMHKLRIQMGHRDAIYKMDGVMELDECFIAGHRPKPNDTQIPPKELDRNEKVLVAVNTIDIPIWQKTKHKPATKARFLKMSIVKSLSHKDVNYEVPKMLKKSCTVYTDGRRCYSQLKAHVQKHQVCIIKDKKQTCKVFPWVHIAISNARKKIQGIHHHVKNEYMQNYLNEFAYKFNRRYFVTNLFDRLIIAALALPWYQAVVNNG